MTAIGENATGWGHGYPPGVAQRTVEDLVGVSVGGHLLVPEFRPFDFLEAPNRPLTYLSAPTNRVAVEAVRGGQPMFHRNADFDEVFFQWAGETTYETECGVVKAHPAELLLIPSGVAHRAIGTSESLRMSVRVRAPLDVIIDASGHIGETRYDITWVGGPEWTAEPDEAGENMFESVHTWDDRPDEETFISRSRSRLIGAQSQGRGLVKVRLFDIFTGLTGAGKRPPTVMSNPDFMIECFNSIGPQRTFHRGNRADETQIQFQGTAENLSEFGTAHMDSGDQYVVRRGIAHRVIGSPRYRRMVFYSEQRWQLHIDPLAPVRTSSFSTQETVIESAPWREEIGSVNV